MEENFDNELYNKYLNGDIKAFEKLYSKYKSKILYFINNVVKDYEKAEDITQDVFIYLIQNKMKEEYSFKYYIYLIAKSRAVSYLNQTKRRNDITEKYLNFKENELEENLDEIIVQEENKKEVLEAIENLDEKYKNAIYLVNIEGLSYKEVSKILDLTL